MKKFFRKYIVFILIILSMITKTPVFAEGDSVNSVVPKVEYQTKQPISKKALALKFIMAMIGVGVSSVLIYVILAGYNKFRYGTTVRYEQTEDNDYKTPNNMKDAINIFLKKTK